GRSCLDLDVGAHVFTVDEIMHADDAGAFDGVVLQKSILDLLRTDVRAVVDDDLLLTTAEPEIAVLVYSHHVAGVQPAVADGGGRRLGIVPIAHRVARGLDPDPAFLAGGTLHAGVVTDRHAVAGTEPPDRASLVDARRGIDTGAVALRHAVDLVDGQAGQIGEFSLQLGGDLVAAGAAKSKRVGALGG